MRTDEGWIRSDDYSNRLNFVCLLVVSFLLCLWNVSRNTSFERPPRTYDGTDYDQIAVQLLNGKGYALDRKDPLFLEPYRKAGVLAAQPYLLGQQKPGATACRPPGLPVVLYVVYRLAGRESFTLVRIIVCLAAAAALAGGLWLVCQRTGRAACWMGLLLALTHVGAYFYRATIIATEPFAAAAAVACAACVLRGLRSRSLWWLFGGGGALGAGLLFRSIFVAYWPTLLAGIFVLARPTRERLPIGGRLLWRLACCAAFTAGFVLVPSPWFVRNVVATQRLMPLGTQGGHAVLLSYNDCVLHQKFAYDSTSKEVKELLATLPTAIPGNASDDTSRIVAEARFAETCTKYAKRWVIRNWRYLPLCFTYKVGQAWSSLLDRRLPFLTVCFLAGAILLGSSDEGRIALLFIASATLAIGVTFADHGRYMYPSLPFLYGLAGAGGVAMVSGYISGVRRYRSTKLASTEEQRGCSVA